MCCVECLSEVILFEHGAVQTKHFKNPGVAPPVDICGSAGSKLYTFVFISKFCRPQCIYVGRCVFFIDDTTDLLINSMDDTQSDKHID